MAISCGMEADMRELGLPRKGAAETTLSGLKAAGLLGAPREIDSSTSDNSPSLGEAGILGL